jgi:hypothetical protein
VNYNTHQDLVGFSLSDRRKSIALRSPCYAQAQGLPSLANPLVACAEPVFCTLCEAESDQLQVQTAYTRVCLIYFSKILGLATRRLTVS